MNVKIEYKNLIKAHNNLDACISQLSEILKDKIEFDFFIMYQPTDGYIIGTQDFGFVKNAPLAYYIKEILKNGTLTKDAYLDLTI